MTNHGHVPSEPFTIAIPAGVLEDLRERLRRARFPVRTPGDPWAAGTDPDYLRTLTTYWADEFDWREQERRLNELPHYRARIDGQAVHFVHARLGCPS